MKKIICFFALLSACTVWVQALQTSAAGACVLLANDQTVLYGHNENSPMAMASTTKIATAIVALENCPLDKSFTVTAKEAGVEGSSMYLQVGETYTLDELLYGLMINSGNDAAAAVATLVAGSQEDFVVLMNDFVKDRGLTQTAFQNPSGLDAKGHHTTAKELAVLTAYALENADFCRYVSTKSITLPGNENRTAKTMVTKNRILKSYPGALGVKTGYTIASGRSLVTAAKRDDAVVVAVTIRDRNDWADHRAMLDFGFANTKIIDFAAYMPASFAVPVAGGGTLEVRGDSVPPLVRGETEAAEIRTQWVLPPFVYSGVGFLAQVGEARFYMGDALLATTPLRSYTSVPCETEKKETLWKGIWNTIKEMLVSFGENST